MTTSTKARIAAREFTALTNLCLQGEEPLDFRVASPHQGQPGEGQEPVQGKAGKGEGSFKQRQRDNGCINAYTYSYIYISEALCK